MSVASFVAAQRTDHGVPHALRCWVLAIAGIDEAHPRFVI